MLFYSDNLDALQRTLLAIKLYPPPPHTHTLACNVRIWLYDVHTEQIGGLDSSRWQQPKYRFMVNALRCALCQIAVIVR